ncbi:helix-turn-helix domain-containing protein [Mucilaginibacter terrenus]|uniref:Helix-turn-helix domain-containing protein n=1 Tax=Mucilaginibacter terrenus TaxID=2482727 RepID=A0A3E2NTY8_9SPHI|nr:ABC transporter permease [Mucilaginibacter terrenus]RFZ84417.1 helix-turn-helix domain-containing protein [Mucilaginibacter terrenus]
MNTYTFHINLFGLVYLATVFTGFIFFLLLWFIKNANTTANRFLAFALLTIIGWIAGILGDDLRLETYLPHWNWIPLQLLPALGPSVYFYVLKLTQPSCQLRQKDILCLIPLLLQLLFLAMQIRESLITGAAIYNTLVFKQLNPSIQLITAALIIAYVYRSLIKIRLFYQNLGFNAANDRQLYEFKWLQRLLIAFALQWLLYILLLTAYHFYHPYKSLVYVYNSLCVTLGITMIWMAVSAFLKQQSAIHTKAAPGSKPLLPLDLKQKGLQLKKAMKTSLYYQDPDLNLNTLAGKVGLSTHDLSRVINTVFKKSFNDFVNDYRVSDVIKKMQSPVHSHITLLGIAYESGFSSQSTFNRIFKQATGKSPLDFKNSLKKELPSYNMGSNSQFGSIISTPETTPSWSQKKLNRSYMYKNYLKIAWRNLTRNKSYTAINITGLAVGIAVCTIIFTVIQYQKSFDGFHTHKDRIYRVLTEYHHTESSTVTYGKDVPFPLPAALKTAFPQAEQIVPVFASQNDELMVGNNDASSQKLFNEQQGVFYTTPEFFKVFDFPLLAGTYTSLKDPNNVLLTKEIAEKYFGNWRTAIGKTIKLQAGGFMFEHGTDVLKVSGILSSIPANTDLQLKIVVSYGTGFTGNYLAQSTDWNTTVSNFGCYVLLPRNATINDFNRELGTFSKRVKSPANRDSHILQPLNLVHYDAEAGNYSNKTVSNNLLNVLWLIAAFILAIACVNFINLSTAQAVNRAKEVGVRKVLGSSKVQLQIQFLTETFLIVICAVILAIVITLIALPYLSHLLELSLSLSLFSDPQLPLFLLFVTIVVTALAGFYPAIVLSRFNPINALKRKISFNNGITFRRGLVAFQFIVAQVLIIATFIIVKQMHYFMNQPLGFDKEAIINIPFRVDSLRISRLDYLKNQLLELNGVKTVSYSSNAPVENGGDTWNTIRFNHSIKETDFKVITKFADDDYVSAYKLQIIAGRNLRPSNLTREFLVNESLVKNLGLKNANDILNKEISIWSDQIKCVVVGVVKDFNNRSFRHGLAPLLISTNNTMYNQAGIKLSTTNMPATILGIKKVFDESFPDFVYEYKFLDEKIASFYKQESQLAALYKLFAAIAIFLSCLGLYGLASFMAVQRVKEVGIRKVLGATAGSIVYLFSKEFITLISIAFMVAAPIAWYYMNQWLHNYVYRIDISWWLFAVGGITALVIALATISFQAINAATANPIKSLRDD